MAKKKYVNKWMEKNKIQEGGSWFLKLIKEMNGEKKNVIKWMEKLKILEGGSWILKLIKEMNGEKKIC